MSGRYPHPRLSPDKAQTSLPTVPAEPSTAPRDVRSADQLLSYLRLLDRWGNALETDLPTPMPAGDPPPRGGLSDQVRGIVSSERRFAVRYAFQHRYTSLIRSRERRRAAALAERSPLLLHLGCGPHPKEGWINIDLAGHPVDVRWNLARPLPFEPGTVDGIFHEHFLEHLPITAGFAFLQTNYELLRPGGILRVVVPDAGAYLKSYSLAGAGFIDDVRPGRPTPMLAIDELFYLYTHAAMYDSETLVLFLNAAGFGQVDVCSMGISRLDPCPDSLHRRSESLYVEAIK